MARQLITSRQELREKIDEVLASFEGKTVADVRDALNGRRGARTFGVDDKPRETAGDDLDHLIDEYVAGLIPEKRPENNSECVYPDHPNNIGCFTAHRPPLPHETVDMPQNKGYNAAIDEISRRAGIGENNG